MSRSGSTFGKVVAWFVAVLLIVCVVFVGVYFGLRSQGKTFYVEYDGQRYRQARIFRKVFNGR